MCACHTGDFVWIWFNMSSSVFTMSWLHQAGCELLVRSTLLDRPNKVYLICSSVWEYVLPSTNSFFDFNEIWHVGRGRWVIHDSMQYDPIQGQGHKPFKVGKPFSNAISFAIYNGSSQLTMVSWTRAQYLNLIRPDFFCPSFLRDWSWQKCQLRRVDRQSRTGLILCYY